MGRLRRAVYGLNPWILSCVATVPLVAEIVLVLFLHRGSPNRLAIVTWAGYAIWTLSAVFGVLPIITLRTRGGVKRGTNYMHTTTLVDSGIYSVVRHPQYLAGMLISLALVLLAQTWLIALLSATVVTLTWLDALKADRYCIDKFGDAYEQYMDRVPRTNALVGIVRLARRGKGT